MTIEFKKPDVTWFETYEYCHRYKYTNDVLDQQHNAMMEELGWKNTGELRFNSGNGFLYIWKREKKDTGFNKIKNRTKYLLKSLWAKIYD